MDTGYISNSISITKSLLLLKMNSQVYHLFKFGVFIYPWLSTIFNLYLLKGKISFSDSHNLKCESKIHFYFERTIWGLQKGHSNQWD